MSDLTLEQAVAILNQHGHRDVKWRAEEGHSWVAGKTWAQSDVDEWFLTPFEAVAVARAYLERERAYLGAGI